MKAGDVILVRFPFSDLESTKKRPSLVLSTIPFSASASLITFAMITSQIDGLKLKGDVLLAKWQEAGLLHPSLVRLSKMTTIDSDLAEKSIGHLASRDLKAVKEEFVKLFHFWL